MITTINEFKKYLLKVENNYTYPSNNSFESINHDVYITDFLNPDEYFIARLSEPQFIGADLDDYSQVYELIKQTTQGTYEITNDDGEYEIIVNVDENGKIYEWKTPLISKINNDEEFKYKFYDFFYDLLNIEIPHPSNKDFIDEDEEYERKYKYNESIKK